MNMGDEIVKKNKYEIDMCNGSIMDKLISFSLPLMLSGILQLMFNAVDIVVVGRFSGSEALAAVGSTTALINVFTNLFIGISLGANVLAARFYASGKDEEMSETVHTSILLALISGIIMAFLGVIFARICLELMDTPEDVIDLSALYMRIYFLGMPFFMLYNYGAAILRAVGDTKRPLVFLIISGCANALLNLFFVIICHLSVAGVGIGTVISQLISCILVLRCLYQTEGSYQLRFSSLSINMEYLKQIFQVGLPAGIQSTVINFSNVLLQSSVNSFGSIAMAGYTAANNIFGFLYVSVNSVTQACMSFTSQNYGAGNLKRCKKIFCLSMLFGIGFTEILSVIFIAGGNIFVHIYTASDAVAMYALIRMQHVCSLEGLTATYEVESAALRGMGKSLEPAIITILGTVVFRMIWMVTVFKRVPTYNMLMNVYVASWVVTGGLIFIIYMQHMKKEEKRKNNLVRTVLLK